VAPYSTLQAQFLVSVWFMRLMPGLGGQRELAKADSGPGKQAQGRNSATWIAWKYREHGTTK
jgi:hypothetical protein